MALATVAQPSLLGFGYPAFDPGFSNLTRTELADGAWFDYVPAWVAGEQTLFDHLAETTAWQSSRRPMYDRIVDVPRLIASIPKHGPGHPILAGIRHALYERYGEPFVKTGMAFYRDRNDSVAPHGDQIARDLDTTVMATVSVGTPRRFRLAPVAGGGGSVTIELGAGDLLVMGGTIQRTWRHSIPKTARPVGPRIAIMFRPPWLG